MKYVLILLLLSGCAKSAPETATEAVLAQIDVVEQKVKQECPQAQIDKETDALRATVHSQLKTCEQRIDTVEAERNTWVVVAVGLIIVILAYWLGKTRKII